MNRLTKTAVASSNAQQVNPALVFTKPVKETVDAVLDPLPERKTADISAKKNGINLTQIPARNNQTVPRIKIHATEPVTDKEENREKESQTESQSFGKKPAVTFATPRTDAGTNEAAQQISTGLLTEDSAVELRKGQMKKTEFLELLRAEITRTIEPILAAVGQTTDGCPYLNYWLDLYHQKDAIHIEQTVKKYAPDSINAKGADEYISIVTQRALRAAAIWAKTGRLSGIPDGVPTTLPGQAPARKIINKTAGRNTVMAKAKEGGTRNVDDPETIQQELGEGQPLSSVVRSRMEPAFGTSFSHVRMHTDSTASRISASVNARAFTVGHHVAFASGEYAPGTLLGDALIAHELAHVMQQKGSFTAVEKMDSTGAQYDALEKDADNTAVNVLGSIWNNENKVAQTGTRSIVSNLRTGLRLQGCCSQPAIPPKTMKNLTVDMVKMRGSNRTPSDDLSRANSIFNNASVNFTTGQDVTVPDNLSNTWLGGDTDVNVAGVTCGAVTGEEKSLYDGPTAHYSLGSRMRVFFVKTFSGYDALAFSRPPYCATGTAASYANHAILKNAALPDTMAHEFGHILLNNEVHHGVDDPSDTCNLMYSPGRTGSVIDASQANTIYNNA